MKKDTDATDGLIGEFPTAASEYKITTDAA